MRNEKSRVWCSLRLLRVWWKPLSSPLSLSPWTTSNITFPVVRSWKALHDFPSNIFLYFFFFCWQSKDRRRGGGRICRRCRRYVQANSGRNNFPSFSFFFRQYLRQFPARSIFPSPSCLLIIHLATLLLSAVYLFINFRELWRGRRGGGRRSLVPRIDCLLPPPVVSAILHVCRSRTECFTWKLDEIHDTVHPRKERSVQCMIWWEIDPPRLVIETSSCI